MEFKSLAWPWGNDCLGDTWKWNFKKMNPAICGNNTEVLRWKRHIRHITSHVILLFFWPCHMACGILSSLTRSSTYSPAGKHGVLTTRLPGTSPFHFILAVEILVKQLAQWTWLHMLTKVFLINFLIIEASSSSQELFIATIIRTLEFVNTNNSLIA